MVIVKNIVLIGMPGCGKSSLGDRLSKRLGLSFIDTDDVLSKMCGKTLGELNQTTTFEEYSKLEEKAVCSIQTQKTVIATGGSVVYSEKAMRHLSENSIIIYIRVRLGVLKKRVGDLKSRGVILPPNTTFDLLYTQRQKYYYKYSEIIYSPSRISLSISAKILANLIRFMYDDVFYA